MALRHACMRNAIQTIELHDCILIEIQLNTSMAWLARDACCFSILFQSRAGHFASCKALQEGERCGVIQP